MKHVHYDIIMQWASDPGNWAVEYIDKDEGRWCETYSPAWDESLVYRLVRKRRRMHLNGVEFPGAERAEPLRGAKFYVPSPVNEDYYAEFEWTGSLCDRRMLDRGLVHLDRFAASLHTAAMLAEKEVK